MNIRPIDLTKDYLTLSQWWTSYEWPTIDYSLLPKTGFIVDDFCAGFLYETDSKFCLLEFVVGNKKSDKAKRDEALDLLIDTLLNTAKQKGFKMVFSSLEHPKLIDRYVKHGFNVTDKNMTNLVRKL